jgi:hypothetical protein
MILTLFNKYLADTLIKSFQYILDTILVTVFFRLGKLNADKYVKEAQNAFLAADMKPS